MEEKMTQLMGELFGEEELSIEEAIVDGIFTISIGENNYRIRTPNFSEKRLAEKERKKYTVELIGTKGYEFEDVLIKSLKKKKIDIKKMESEFEKLQEEIHIKWLSLAKMTKREESQEDKKAIEDRKIEISQLLAKQMQISIDKYKYMQYSIESEAEQRYILFLIILCTDIKKKNGNYIRLYKDLDSFDHGDEELNNRLVYYASHLFFKSRDLKDV